MPHPKQNDEPPVDNTPDGPIRQCAVTRERLAQTEMVRYARAPDGSVAPDVAAQLPGRGVWISANRATLETAMAKGTFSKGFKAQSKADEALPDLVEALLVKRLQGVLGMAKKAGKVVLGYDQVRASLQKRRPGILLEAGDGAEDGRNKVYFLAKALYENVKVSGGLSSAELGMAFGRSGVVHGLLEAGAFSKRWWGDYQRLIGFRQAPEQDWFSGISRE